MSVKPRAVLTRLVGFHLRGATSPASASLGVGCHGFLKSGTVPGNVWPGSCSCSGPQSVAFFRWHAHLPSAIALGRVSCPEDSKVTSNYGILSLIPLTTVCLHTLVFLKDFKILVEWQGREGSVVCVQEAHMFFCIRFAESWPIHGRIQKCKGYRAALINLSSSSAPPPISCTIFDFIMKCHFIMLSF